MKLLPSFSFLLILATTLFVIPGTARSQTSSEARSFGVLGTFTKTHLFLEGKMRSISGERIKSVSPGSIADLAGVQRDDVIVKWGDHYVDADPPLPQLIKRSTHKDKVRFKVLRAGKLKTLTASFSRSSNSYRSRARVASGFRESSSEISDSFDVSTMEWASEDGSVFTSKSENSHSLATSKKPISEPIQTTPLENQSTSLSASTKGKCMMVMGRENEQLRGHRLLWVFVLP